jgi:hypothetical protein
MTVDTGRASESLRRTTALSGFAALVLVFAGQALVQIGGAEPPFDAPAADIAAFFDTRDARLFPIGSYLSILGLVAMLWFFAGIYGLMREDWRAVVALVSGIMFVAVVGVPGWELASSRVSEGVDPQLARLAFDMGNLAFATGWVALGSFAIATGWSALSTRQLSRWLGWCAVAAGVCLVAARVIWTNPFWLVGYALFWVWVVAVGVTLLRGRRPGTSRRDIPAVAG